MSLPRRGRSKPIPRLRRVDVRLEPHYYEALTRHANAGGITIEQLAAQIIRKDMLGRPRASAAVR